MFEKMIYIYIIYVYDSFGCFGKMSYTLTLFFTQIVGYFVFHFVIPVRWSAFRQEAIIVI